MRVRSFGFLILVLAGVVPLVIFGYVAVDRSRDTAADEVRAGNARVAHAVAGRVGAFLESEDRILASLGASATHTREARRAGMVLEAHSLANAHVREPAIYVGGAVWAGAAVEGRDAMVAKAMAEGGARSPVTVDAQHGTGYAMTIAQRIELAGKHEGVIVADIDLVGLWPPINQVRVGDTGFVRLLSGGGELLAHGNPEERRHVFDPDREVDRKLVAAARAGRMGRNQSGEEVVASVADVPGTDWVVVVEQSASEAFAAARVLTRNLIIFAGAALIVLAVLGLYLGRKLVRPIERLRAHTALLGQGDLDARIDAGTRLVEIRALADGLNDMAASLDELQREAQARERLTTFARIAAGLAHDLRVPIESVRAACEAVLMAPGDDSSVRILETISKRDLPRLKEFVDDLRMLSRTGVSELVTEDFDAAELARDLAEELGTYAKWRGVSFVAEGERAPVAASQKLVRRAIFNLASNGADACLEKGRGGTVSIRVEAAGDRVRIEVADTGVGIPPDRVSHLLGGDFASTKRTSGIGLGLGVARHVARTHGGELGVESELGAGTRFVLTLPRDLLVEADPSELKGNDYGGERGASIAI